MYSGNGSVMWGIVAGSAVYANEQISTGRAHGFDHPVGKLL
jgi:hypothetical protein